MADEDVAEEVVAGEEDATEAAVELYLRRHRTAKAA